MVRLFKALTKYPDRYIQWPLLAFLPPVISKRDVYNWAFLCFLEGNLFFPSPEKRRMKEEINPRW
jgi:hypothetical protein